MALDGVDEQRDAGRINQIHRELGALGHGTADNRGAGGTEHGLENQKALHGQIAFIEREVAPVGHADEACALAAEHKAEAEEEEQK